MDFWACSKDRPDRRRLRKNICARNIQELLLYIQHSRVERNVGLAYGIEKLTEQNTHIKNEKKVEGDVSENIKQCGLINF